MEKKPFLIREYDALRKVVVLRQKPTAKGHPVFPILFCQHVHGQGFVRLPFHLDAKDAPNCCCREIQVAASSANVGLGVSFEVILNALYIFWSDSRRFFLLELTRCSACFFEASDKILKSFAVRRLFVMLRAFLLFVESTAKLRWR